MDKQISARSQKYMFVEFIQNKYKYQLTCIDRARGKVVQEQS